MTQEEKQLLFNDLCARLSYGVKILDIPANVVGKPFLVSTTDMVEYDPEDETNDDNWSQTLYNIKPYLRPMSSMTEEEKDNLQSLHNIISDENYGDGYSPSAWDAITEWEDYCNARHLDYRGLIEKGLALEAPEGMYD